MDLLKKKLNMGNNSFAGESQFQGGRFYFVDEVIDFSAPDASGNGTYKSTNLRYNETGKEMKYRVENDTVFLSQFLPSLPEREYVLEGHFLVNKENYITGIPNERYFDLIMEKGRNDDGSPVDIYNYKSDGILETIYNNKRNEYDPPDKKDEVVRHYFRYVHEGKFLLKCENEKSDLVFDVLYVTDDGEGKIFYYDEEGKRELESVVRRLQLKLPEYAV